MKKGINTLRIPFQAEKPCTSPIDFARIIKDQMATTDSIIIPMFKIVVA
jgi:hypothetical protein